MPKAKQLLSGKVRLRSSVNEVYVFNENWISFTLPTTAAIKGEKITISLKEYIVSSKISESVSYNVTETGYYKLFVNNGYTNESMLQELTHYAKFYNYFLHKNNELSIEVNNYLDALRQLRQTTLYVFLFKIFDDYENNVISDVELTKILKFLFNYCVRRSVCEIGSNSLRGLFKTLYVRVFNKKENYNYYVDSILSFFHQLNTKDKIPSDAYFVECLKGKDLYHKNNVCKYVLSALENRNTKEPIEIKTLTIEHIMPQNEDLSKDWRTMLGENWNEVHTKYLNTLGNLTLTGYNSELSDKPFKEKKAMVEQNSKIKNLNKDVLDKDAWNETTITDRADRLSKEVLEIFEIEKPTVEISYKDTSYKEYGIENPDDAKFKYPNYYVLQGEKVEVNDFSDMLESVMKTLYELDNTIMERIAKNGEKLITWSQKIYVSYDKEQFRYCEEIEGSGIFYDTNLSAPSKVWLIKGMLNEYGIETSEFLYSAKSNKKPGTEEGEE